MSTILNAPGKDRVESVCIKSVGNIGMSSNEEVVQKLEKLAFEGHLVTRAGFNRLWNQVTGYGVPRQVEGFQATPAGQAETMLSTFFGVWNNWPTGLSRDSGGAINTMVASTWSGYVVTTSPFKGTKFGELTGTLSSSITLTFSYTNSSTANSAVFYSVNVNNISLPNFTLTVNPYQNETTVCNDAGRQYFIGYSSGNTSYNGCGTGGFADTGCYELIPCTRPGWAGTRYWANPNKNHTWTPARFGTGSVAQTFTLTSPIVLFRFSYWTSLAINSITHNSVIYYPTNNAITMTNLGKIIFDFNNIYTALLIDLYTGINTRHSTTPTSLPVPYTAPTFTPAINTTTDRTNAMAGTNTDTIKNNYLSNYLPGLYLSVYRQTWTLLNDMNASWSSIPSTVRTSTFSAISNIATDFATINGMASAATADNVVANIRTITNFYNTYASNYTNVMRQGTFYGYVVEFLTNLYTPALAYINAPDLTITTQTLVITARTYISAGASTSSFAMATNLATDITNVRGQFETAIRNVLQTLVNSLSTLGGNPSDFVMPATVAAAIATPPTLPTNFSELAAFRTTILGHYASWLAAMQAYLRTYIDGYVRDASGAGVVPTLNADTYKGYVDATAAPWIVKDGVYDRIEITSLSNNTPDVSTASIPELSGTYKITASVNEANAWKAFSNKTGNQWTFPSTTTSAWLQLEVPNPISVYRHSCFQGTMGFKVPFFQKLVLEGSNNGTTYSNIYTATTSTESTLSQTYNKTLDHTSDKYKFFRLLFSNPFTSTTTATSFYISFTQFYAHSGTISSTKIAQLRAIFNLFRDANAAFEAIGKVRDFYNESYTKGARYLSAADMTNMTYAAPYASATLTLQQVAAKCLNYLNPNGTTKNTTLQAGDASFTDLVTLMDSANARMVTAMIDRYFATLTTWQTRGVTRPANIPTDGTADKAAVATTLAATRTTYLGHWVTLLESLKTRTRAVLNQAKDLQTWRTTTTSYTFASNPSISVKGLA